MNGWGRGGGDIVVNMIALYFVNPSLNLTEYYYGVKSCLKTMKKRPGMGPVYKKVIKVFPQLILDVPKPISLYI